MINTIVLSYFILCQKNKNSNLRPVHLTPSHIKESSEEGRRTLY